MRLIIDIKLFIRAKFYLVAILMIFVQFGGAQTGNYYITNYTPSNYYAGDQNRGIVQDNAGRIYVANLNGIVYYDGEYWKITKVKQDYTAYSLDANKNGHVFVGSEGDFGFLENKKNGELVYSSLSDKLNDKDRDFSTVWSTNCLENEVSFLSPEKLFVYNYNTIQTFTPQKGEFHRQFKVGKHLFVRESGNGFWVYQNKKLDFVKGSEEFGEIKVRFIVPKIENQYWVGTQSGLYLLKYNLNKPTESTFEKALSDLDDWLINNQVYCGKQLSNGSYIIGSQKKGILLLNKDFRVEGALTYKTGLQDDNICTIYEDNSGNIWLSLNKGISYIEVNTPITKWSKSDGVIGTIEASCKYQDKIFIATDKGVQFYDPELKEFKNTPILSQTFDLISTPSGLFVAADGIYSYTNNNYNLALECGYTSKLLLDKNDPSKLYIGGDGFIIIGKINNTKIEIIKKIEINGDARNIFEFNNKVYFGVNSMGIIELNKNNLDTIIYDTKDGLLDINENSFFSFQNKLHVGTPNGIYTFNPSGKKKFTREPQYNPYEEHKQVGKPVLINNELFFQLTYQFENISKHDELTSLKWENNKFIEDKKYLKRIRDVSTKHFYQSNNFAYISTNEGLFCYDLSYSKKPFPFITLISQIYAKQDTLLHNLSENNLTNLKINYSSNQIHFDLAASNFIDKHEMEFSFYLEGTSDTYGKWTKNNTAAFNNLHEGKYIFHAKSRDVLGQEGKEISFSFTILPPWYRTTWAYIAYFILFIIVVWIIVALNTKRLRAQNIKLENTITERTKTIAHQMVEIEHKNKEITDSINYAKGIQDSILPDIKDIKNTWKDTFVYFQPKDIVSGDFFWYKKINDNEFLIACADCTGHGVPGGFMSMICSDKLHDSAKESVQPKDILFGTNNGVKTTLKQEIIVEGKSKDGMEVCLLKVNTQTQEISYSGANRLLWIVDGETKELTEIKPTKASIASFTEFNFEYQQHDFKLKKGDMVYATSDGFPDQFGGGEGKKYMSKKMKAYILSICNLPMDEQHDLLKKEINDWMMGHEQVDDLLVIGVRL